MKDGLQPRHRLMRERQPDGSVELRDCTPGEDEEIQKVDDVIGAVMRWAIFIVSAALVAAVLRWAPCK